MVRPGPRRDHRRAGVAGADGQAGADQDADPCPAAVLAVVRFPELIVRCQLVLVGFVEHHGADCAAVGEDEFGCEVVTFHHHRGARLEVIGDYRGEGRS